MSAVWVVCVIPALGAFAALAVDGGYLYMVREQAQCIADSAARAGTSGLSNSQWFNNASGVVASTGTYTTASHPLTQWVSITPPSSSNTNYAAEGYWNGSTFYYSDGTNFQAGAGGSATLNAVKVHLYLSNTHHVFTGFLHASISPTVQVSAIATKSASGPGTVGAGVVLLDSTASPALHLNDTAATLTVSNGAMVINSNSSTAVTWGGNATINATSVDVVGNDTALATGGIVQSPGTVTLNVGAVTDPLASLPAPSKGTTRSSPYPATLLPGYYANGLPSGATLSTGIYYVDGGLSGSINGSSGVMIYLNTGGINLNGNTTINITPLSSGTYKGVSIFSARSNTSGLTSHGTPTITTTGTLYLPDFDVAITGNPGITADQLIANTLSLTGHGSVIINYDGRNPTPVAGGVSGSTVHRVQ